jgi:hypothetical protein
MPFANIVFGFWIETVVFDQKTRRLGLLFILAYLLKSLVRFGTNPPNLTLWGI